MVVVTWYAIRRYNANLIERIEILLSRITFAPNFCARSACAHANVCVCVLILAKTFHQLVIRTENPLNRVWWKCESSVRQAVSLNQFVFVCRYPLNSRAYQKRNKNEIWTLWTLNCSQSNRLLTACAACAATDSNSTALLPSVSLSLARDSIEFRKQTSLRENETMGRTHTRAECLNVVSTKVCISSHLCFICDMLNISNSNRYSVSMFESQFVCAHAHSGTHIHTPRFILVTVAITVCEWLEELDAMRNMEWKIAEIKSNTLNANDISMLDKFDRSWRCISTCIKQAAVLAFAVHNIELVLNWIN